MQAIKLGKDPMQIFTRFRKRIPKSGMLLSFSKYH
jgi:hypothetical protein